MYEHIVCVLNTSAQGQVQEHNPKRMRKGVEVDEGDSSSEDSGSSVAGAAQNGPPPDAEDTSHAEEEVEGVAAGSGHH